jgi:hypothetical protein
MEATMTDIQRWTPAWDGKEVGTYADSTGEFVLYADHVEALRQAVQRLEALDECGCLPADAVSVAWVCDQCRYIAAVKGDRHE